MSHTAVDEYLSSLGKWRNCIVKDGSCLFRAVAHHLYGCQARHVDVRAACCDYVESHKDHYKFFIEVDVPFNDYLRQMREPFKWGGHIEIDALQNLYNLKFTIFRELPTPSYDDQFATPVSEDGMAKSTFQKTHIEVCYAGNNHYDLVYSKRYYESASKVQDLLYDILAEAIDMPRIRCPTSYRNGETQSWVRPSPTGRIGDISQRKKRSDHLEINATIKHKNGKGKKNKGRKQRQFQVISLDLADPDDEDGHSDLPTDYVAPDTTQHFPILGTGESGFSSLDDTQNIDATSQKEDDVPVRAPVNQWGAKKEWTKEFAQPTSTDEVLEDSINRYNPTAAKINNATIEGGNDGNLENDTYKEPDDKFQEQVDLPKPVLAEISETTNNVFGAKSSKRTKQRDRTQKVFESDHNNKSENKYENNRDINTSDQAGPTDGFSAFDARETESFPALGDKSPSRHKNESVWGSESRHASAQPLSNTEAGTKENEVVEISHVLHDTSLSASKFTPTFEATNTLPEINRLSPDPAQHAKLDQNVHGPHYHPPIFQQIHPGQNGYYQPQLPQMPYNQGPYLGGASVPMMLTPQQVAFQQQIAYQQQMAYEQQMQFINNAHYQQYYGNNMPPK